MGLINDYGSVAQTLVLLICFSEAHDNEKM